MPGGMSIGNGGGHAKAGNVPGTGPTAECVGLPERVERRRMQAAGGAQVRKGLYQTGGERPKRKA